MGGAVSRGLAEVPADRIPAAVAAHETRLQIISHEQQRDEKYRLKQGERLGSLEQWRHAQEVQREQDRAQLDRRFSKLEGLLARDRADLLDMIRSDRRLVRALVAVVLGVASVAGGFGLLQ